MTQADTPFSDKLSMEPGGHYCVHIHEQSQDRVSDDENITIRGPVPKFIKILVPVTWKFDTVDNVLFITSETQQTTKIIFCNHPKIRIVTEGLTEDSRTGVAPCNRLPTVEPQTSGGYKAWKSSILPRLKPDRLSWEKPMIFKYSSAGRGVRQLLLYQFPPIEHVLEARAGGTRWDSFVRTLLARAVSNNQDDPIFLVMDPKAITRAQDLVRQTKMLSGPETAEDQDCGTPRRRGRARIVRPAPTDQDSRQHGDSRAPAARKGVSKRCRRQQRPRESRTAIKCLSPTKLLSAELRRAFRMYSSLGSPLNSGVAITRWNSNYWLQVSGVVTDLESHQMASTLFMATAGSKVVLGIFDYLRYLMLLSRQRRIVLAELVTQMTEEGLKHFPFRRISQDCKSTNSSPDMKGQRARRSTSMPILRTQSAGAQEIGQNKGNLSQPKDLETKNRQSSMF